MIVSSPVHPSSVSSAPWGGLGWFLGAAVRYPSPSWLEEKEGEMGTRQNHIMLLAFQPAGKLPGKLRKEEDARTSWQEASGRVLAMRELVGVEDTAWRGTGMGKGFPKLGLQDNAIPAGRSKPQRSHSTSLPSISSTCREQISACSHLPPRRTSPPSPSWKPRWVGSLVLKTEWSLLIRHCSVGNCFFSFPLSW